MAITQSVLALLTSLPFAFIAMMISGFANAFTLIARRVLLQRNTPNELRGRMFSAFLSVGNLALTLGMATAGLADLINVRLLFLIATVPLLLAGLLVLALPGLRQSLAEWWQATRLLRGMVSAPGLGRGNAATLGDFDRLANHLPALFRLSPVEQRTLLSQARVYDVPAGTAIMREGEPGNTAYFIIDGRAVAAKTAHDTQRALGLLYAGDIFGEIGALMGTPRSATVLAQEPSSVMQVPAAVLRQLMGNAALNTVLLERMLARMDRMRTMSEPQVGMGAQPMRRAPEMPSQIMRPQPRSAAEATKALLSGAGANATVILSGQL
jgi:CRP-like cAMP-binding protein